ncbi:hypothetical protein [Chondrinema litorale]|uniref:hypothetical protein n=1 Tax=Chondrinema litorale TaxID=2994555 RepID=UPI0025431133|nr:hypothetical protein [Chondrinema litorale]UZR98984.1 hypothetical protein OQ292_33850 [Chondrinema litorale]
MIRLILISLTAFVTQLTFGQDTVFPIGNKTPNVHHIGDVWLNYLSDADETFDYNIVLATMSTGAKLNWHLHPTDQQLLVTITRHLESKSK